MLSVPKTSMHLAPYCSAWQFCFPTIALLFLWGFIEMYEEKRHLKKHKGLTAWQIDSN